MDVVVDVVVPLVVPDVVVDEVVEEVVVPEVVDVVCGLLTSVVVPLRRSRTNTFDPLPEGAVLVMLLAWESKATKRPSPEMAGSWLSPFDSAVVLVDVVPIDARVDWPLARFQTKMFERPAVMGVEMLEFRLLAVDSKATKKPLLLMDGFELSPFTAEPWSGVTSVRVPPWISRTKILIWPAAPVVAEVVPVVVPVVVPPETKLPAADWNATKRPSAEMLGFVLSAFASAPLAVALTSTTWLLDMFHTNTFFRPLVDDEVEPDTMFVALDSNAII